MTERQAILFTKGSIKIIIKLKLKNKNFYDK